MCKLYITVGAPGAGKSTYIKQNFDLTKVNYVSRDEIRFALVPEEEEYFSKEDEVYDVFVMAIQSGLDCGRDVIADATHLSANSRNKLLDRLNIEDVDLYAIYFNESLDWCLANNDKREGRSHVPQSAVRRMFYQLTQPNHEKDKYTYNVIEVKQSDLAK